MTNKPLAVVTGAAQGIGYACAEALMEDGYQVILVDINVEGVVDAAVSYTHLTLPTIHLV